MQTRKKTILDSLIKQIPPYIITDSVNIEKWTVKKGVHAEPGKFIYSDEPGVEMHLGDSWTSTYDDTVWFSSSLEIPKKLVSKKLYLQFDFGGEAIVRINGKIAGAVSSRMKSGWVHRDIIFLPDPLPKDRVLHIEIEATVNSGALCDVVLAGGDHIDYTMAIARLIAVDPVVESYYNDVQIVSAALSEIRDAAISARVYAALDDSLHTIDFDFDDATVRASFKPAAELLWDRIEKIKYQPQGDVILTGHSHIDVAWLWTVKEVLRKTARTFSNTTELMDRYPELVFAQSQAILYDMMKTHYPEVYENIKKKVASGNWDIVGNAWVEADTNIASGESLIRQLLYGREFFLKEFGKSSDIYWLPDCFGFSYALPQIIKKSGMKYFLTTKLNWQDTNRFPHTIFRWRGADGSEVLAYLQRTMYGDDCTVNKVTQSWDQNDEKAVTDTVMGMFGYGDGGGGVTYQMVEDARRIAKIPGIPSSRIGHASEFFAASEAHRDELPVWEDEMYYENHRGTYSSQGFVKKYNRYGEFLLTRAEMAACFAAGMVKNAALDEKLKEAWKLLLVNQFHDILPGTSIHEVYDNTRKEYARMAEIGEERLHASISDILSRIGLNQNSVVCFNFSSFAVSETVSVELPDDTLVPCADGEALPYAYEKTEGGFKLSFVAKDVPAMGYRAFPLCEKKAVKARVKATPNLLENEFLRISLDENGEIVSVYDKENDRETLCAPGNALTIYADKPVHESAWNLEADYVKKAWPLKKADSVEAIESSALRGVVRVVRSFNKSKITQDITLCAGSRRIDFITHADWYETEKILRAAFPVSVRASYAAYEIAHGAIWRPTHMNTSYDCAKYEVCAHKWADLSEGGYGVAVLNNCKYGYDIHSSVIGITLLRSPNCPDITADKGIHDFTYSYYPHKNGWQDGGVVREAFALNLPPHAYLRGAQTGALPETYAFIQTNRGDIVIDAVKPAQDGNGVIIRLYESESRRGNVNLTLNLPFDTVRECSMMEEDLENSEVKRTDGGFSFYIEPFEVKTFRVR